MKTVVAKVFGSNYTLVYSVIRDRTGLYGVEAAEIRRGVQEKIAYSGAVFAVRTEAAHFAKSLASEAISPEHLPEITEDLFGEALRALSV